MLAMRQRYRNSPPSVGVPSAVPCMAPGLTAPAYMAHHLRSATGFAGAGPTVGPHRPGTMVGGDRHTIPADGPYGTGGATRHRDGVHPAGIVRVADSLTRPCQGPGRPQKGPCGAWRDHGVGPVGAAAAPTGGAARSSQDGHELTPPDVGTAPAAAQHTTHSARLHTQPSRLALPVCKTIGAVTFW